MKSGVRVDQLTAIPTDRQLFLLKEIRKQVDDEAMPPEDEPQPTAEERKLLTEWISSTMTAALKRETKKSGSVRRLTVAQYRNSLRDLLALDEDLTEVLPQDGISKDGFTNNSQTLILSPLQVEKYFEIADQALDLCIVDPDSKPQIQNFRMDLGRGINATPCPDNLILGANSHLLNNADFEVTQLTAKKPFPFDPFFMQTKFEFIEGYVGNDTIREWRKFDSIYHAVFACMRGSPGYPKGEAFQVVPSGLLLRPAIPSSGIFGVSSTYGPMANFKISLRELPDRGNIRIKVTASRYRDALLLDSADPPISSDTTPIKKEITDLKATPASTLTLPDPGIYHVDLYRPLESTGGLLSLEIGSLDVTRTLPDSRKPAQDEKTQGVVEGTSILVARLDAGPLKFSARLGNNGTLSKIVITKLPEDHVHAQKFLAYERRSPSLGVYLGLRRDCGSTLARVGNPVLVSSPDFQEFIFTGPINDFPSPDVEKNNVNYLAGVREIGLRCEYTDGRDMPRLRIRSIEVEGPYYDQWPPASHTRIFVPSQHHQDPTAYAREILESFASRAFRRPVTPEEMNSLFSVWEASYRGNPDFRQSIKDALLVVLTSPQFLFLIEESTTPEAEDLDGYELASKLSYFLWNTSPDDALLQWAAQQDHQASLDDQIDRLLDDPRFSQFTREFVAQWLTLDKFDVLSVDAKKFPRLTRDTQSELRHEPVRFIEHLIRQNLPLRNLIQSDFILANEVVADYYQLGDRTNSGFEFIPIRHGNEHLGGLLTQAGILAGLSDGRESNPVKRGAWIARKIIAEPPDDPPPNVPKLPEDDGEQLTLAQKLERHRNQEGCAKCHSGIDPWGLPFEQYDAGGLFRPSIMESPSKLPDGTDVRDLNGLRAYLADDRMDQVAFSFLKHLSTYAVGRSLTYNELVFLQTEGLKLRDGGYRTRDMIHFVIKSDLFLKK